MSAAEDAVRRLPEWKEEIEPAPSVHDVEGTLLQLYESLGSPTTSSLTQQERQLAERTASSYLFGEVLPAGVSKMLDDEHLDAASAQVMFDLGMGCGRLCMQAFLQYPNLLEVVGVELSSSRSSVGMEAMERLYELQLDSKSVHWQLEIGNQPPYATLTAARRVHTKRSRGEVELSRVLSFHEGNLFDVPDAARADVVILETNILQARWLDLVHLLATFKVGSRILTYNRLEDIYGLLRAHSLDDAPLADRFIFPWRKLPERCGEDHYAASWGNARFHIYRKVL